MGNQFNVVIQGEITFSHAQAWSLEDGEINCANQFKMQPDVFDLGRLERGEGSTDSPWDR